MTRRAHHRRIRDVVRPNDVAAAGFAVSLRATATTRLIISRERSGEWRVVDDSDFRAIPEQLLYKAISISAAVISGANLSGTLVTELAIDDDVRWVKVSYLEN